MNALDGKDTLAILPTGAGKSICFQVPALVKEGLCLVVSPLIALMKDQVESLAARGIPAIFIYAGMSFSETKDALRKAAFNDYKFLYVSPERLQSELFREFLPSLKLSFIAVDEAHCISQWGYDFRPSYLLISAIRKEVPSVPVIALTASATPIVEADISEKLLFDKNAKIFRGSFTRPNLAFWVTDPPSKQAALPDILKKHEGSAIVYCRTRKQTKDISESLSLRGISSDFYHAGLLQNERSAKQTDWINGRTRVMVCTNAFGMGIDKPDVRLVVHVGIPDSPENYYQEAGRAGRDGEKAFAILLYNQGEIRQLFENAEKKFPTEERIRVIYQALMNYLQVPAGSGEEMSFDFEIGNFCSAFSLDANEALYALQAFAKDGILSFTESISRPSRVQVLADKNELKEYFSMKPGQEEIILALLRSYEGIMDHPAAINENRLADFAGISQEELLQRLSALHHDGMIQFERKSDKPTIYLLKNRMYSDDLSFDFRGLAERKKAWLERIEAMKDYVNTKLCRSQFLSRYFGDNEAGPCGICDNCNKIKPARTTREDILNRITGSELTISQLRNSFPLEAEEDFWKHYKMLESEGIIRISAKGVLQANGRG